MVEDSWDDPNCWIGCSEYRVYADDYANDYAIVDEIDYQYLIQWRWKLKKSRTWLGTKKPKVYLARSIHVSTGPTHRDRIVPTLFLHTAIMERRTDIEKPITNERIIVDHADGDGFNCRRKNLRYTSISFNNKNINGSHELVMEI